MVLQSSTVTTEAPTSVARKKVTSVSETILDLLSNERQHPVKGAPLRSEPNGYLYSLRRVVPLFKVELEHCCVLIHNSAEIIDSPLRISGEVIENLWVE